MPPFDAFWAARYAVVADPDGNDVGLMSLWRNPAGHGRRSHPPRLDADLDEAALRLAENQHGPRPEPGSHARRTPRKRPRWPHRRPTPCSAEMRMLTAAMAIFRIFDWVLQSAADSKPSANARRLCSLT